MTVNAIGIYFIRGLKYFMDSVLQLSKSILFEPPDWANFVAMFILNQRDAENKFVRLSPLIYSDSNSESDISSLVKDLHNLDMDLIKDEDVGKIETCFQAWVKGKIMNQPIQGFFKKGVYKCRFGQKSFDIGIKEWLEADKAN